MEDYLTVAQAAALLGVARDTIYDALASGALTEHRIMGKRALKQGDLEAFAKTLRPAEWREKQRESRKK